MRVLIVDDESLARAYLAEQLGGIADIEIVGQAANGFEAVKLAEELSPDLMLLDVQMPKLSGFEVLELLADRAPAVVFVTAHDEFALRAFEVHAVDYLMKPVEPARLIGALERAAERVTQSHAGAGRPGARHDAARQPGPAARTRSDPRRRHASTCCPLIRSTLWKRRTIIYPSLQGESASANSRRWRKSKRSSIGTRFVRIHRSFLLNVERLARIEPYAKDSWLAVLADGTTRLPVSRTGYSRLKELIG